VTFSWTKGPTYGRLRRARYANCCGTLFHGTGAIALRHGSYVVRYCEVKTDSLANVKQKQVFEAGEVIAKVGRMLILSMLHLELYAGSAVGGLTVRTNAPTSGGPTC